MADYYADSSVLIKRHVREAGTDWFRALADPSSSQVITTARISEIEVYSALNRRAREAILTPAQYAEIIADFSSFCLTEYQFIELTPAVVARARHVLEHHALRAYDAVQLASALVVGDSLALAGLVAPIFTSSDERLLNAARQEGLLTANPNLYL